MIAYVKREAASRMFDRYFQKMNGKEAKALVADMKQSFRALPYIEAEPVKHGRWMDNMDENGMLCNAWRK